jgi:hypothetical protein
MSDLQTPPPGYYWIYTPRFISNPVIGFFSHLYGSDLNESYRNKPTRYELSYGEYDHWEWDPALDDGTYIVGPLIPPTEK